MPDNLPRVPDPMTGLWPRSMFNIAYLQEPVKDDQMAQIILSEAAALESAKAQVAAWASVMAERYDKALAVISESAAFKSLADYVKVTTGKKTLELPAGVLRVRTQKGILRIYDPAAVKRELPDATYKYQAPEAVKLSNEKVKAELAKRDGKLTVETPAGAVVVAEIIASVETLSFDARQPSGLADAGGQHGPRLLSAQMEEEKRRGDENTDGNGSGDQSGQVGSGATGGAPSSA